MVNRQQSDLLSEIEFQNRIKMVLNAFPGSRVLTPEEVQSLNSHTHNEQKTQVQKTHKEAARGRRSAETDGPPASASSDGHEQLNFDFFDQVHSRGGAND